jgi:hypothetical protein
MDMGYVNTDVAAAQLGNCGGGVGLKASASRATGQGAGNGTTYTNTQVAGNTINITSGGANTPYRDLYNRVEAAKAGTPTNPNAGLNTITPNQKGQVTAEAAAGLSGVKNPVRDINDIRGDVADGAEVVSRGAGIVGGTETAASKIPGPHQPGAATTAVVATGVGFAADVIEQVARPDMGKLITGGTIDIAVKPIVDKFPLTAPVVNDAANVLKNPTFTEKIQNAIGEKVDK